MAKPRTVKQVLVSEGKVIVEGVNIISRHTKPSAQNTKGWNYKEGSADPYQQCDVVGCERKVRCEGEKRKK